VRVHRLEITAFGPFGGTESLDFEGPNAAGIFLLTGQTGAGKTSVLDAISFALFGAVPGARNRAKAFKSQHAADATAPSVELDVTLRGRRFRVRRSPAWSRPSTRAKSGYVDEHARVTVEERVDEEWLSRATRLDEAGLLISRLLGMTHEQFCQVVMLPQGQFETFLRADAKERHDLLESLFETRRFHRVEQWLAEHRREQEAGCAAVQRGIDELAARAAEVAGLVEEAGALAAPETGTAVDRLGLVRDRHDAMVAAVAAARELAEARLEAAKAAQHARDEAARLAERQERHREARRRWDALTALQPTVDERIHQVERAQAAATLAPLESLLTTAERQHRDARARRDRQLARLSDVLPDARLCAEPATAVQPLLLRTREQRGRLAELRSVEEQIDRLATQLVDSQDQLAGLERQLTTVAARSAVLPAALDHATSCLEETALRAGHHEAAVELLHRARLRLQAATDVERLTREVAAAQERLVSAREAKVTAAEAVQLLRARRLEGFASELAAGLVAGHPCPVCGSHSHPEPARETPDQVSEQDELAASLTLESAEVAVDDSAGRLERLRSALAAAEAGADGASVAAAAEAVATARENVDLADHARSRLADVQTRVAELSEEQADVDRAVDGLRASAAATTARRDATTEQLEQARARIAPALEGFASVTERLDALDHALALLETTDEVCAAHDRAATEVDVRRRHLDEALADSTFADVDELRAAALPKADLANLDALNRAHADEVSTVRRILDDPALLEAAHTDEPDLPTLAGLADETDRLRAEAHAQAHDLAARTERLGELIDQWAAAEREAAPLHAARALAEQVAGMVAGTARDNQHKTKLSHYVVAARLEQVVAAANVRLRDIGAGRYQLAHSLARSAGASRGGLSLVVIDTYTGLRRDPATLSGGETFYVSLALALGLADLVRTEAGGAELSTLFVDEGFGGLDADTLDEVMDAIDELRSGGRSVGLVSHLSELRLRVPTQVHIVRGRNGSRIKEPS
jgi:exonuclease SbcC